MQSMWCDFCIDEGLKEHIEEFTKRNWKRSHVKNVIFRSLVFLTWLKFMHARKHSLKTTRLECFQYDKTFAEKKLSHTTLIRHTLETKNHKCTECEKTLVTSGTLRIHLRIHTGQKPYKCSQCLKSFPQNNTLNHTKIHAGVRLFSCVHCEKPMMT